MEPASTDDKANGTTDDPKGRARETLLARLGRLAARHPWRFLAVWVVLLVASAALYPQFQSKQTTVVYTVDGSASERVEQMLRTEFPDLGTERDVVVFRSERLTVTDLAFQQAMKRVQENLRKRPEVRDIVPLSQAGTDGAQVSADRHTAVIPVTMRGSATELQDNATELQDIAGDTGTPQVKGYLVGFSPISDAILRLEASSAERAEMIGVPIALAILLLATGAVVASLLPLLTAAAGVVLAFGVLGAIAYATTMDGILSTVVPMIGLGVGIDYTLFIVTRFREELMRRTPAGERPSRGLVADALAVSMDRTGRTILYSGIVVALSLLTLLALQARTFRQLAMGTSLAVLCALLVGLTLLPAVLALLGHRVERGRLPWRNRVVRAGKTASGHGVFGTWARWVMRHPVLVGLVATAILVVAALPMLNLRLGIDLGFSALKDTPAGKGQAVLARHFSPGVVMPVEVIYTSRDGKLAQRDLAAIRRFAQAAGQDPAVAAVSWAGNAATGAKPPPAPGQILSSPLVSEDGRSTSITIIPSVAPDTTRAMDLVERLRHEHAPQTTGDVPGARVYVGGSTAQFVDLSNETKDKLWIVIGLVLVLSFAFLTIVFRSLLLPLKAIIMNVLATGAAYGLIVWVFQEGHLEGVFDFTASGTIQAYLPLVAFVLLFGLSMDYEVFLVRWIQETWERTKDNEHSVAVGLEHTALPITAAAAIMIAVFGSFVTADILELKQIGFALAAAILIDATLVRIVLVPAVMRLAGRANWWFPDALDKRLPGPRLD